MGARKRKKSYYPLSEVREKIAQGKVLVRSNALDDARRDFGWGVDEILDAICKLKPKHFHKHAESKVRPPTMLDIYKADGLKGEDIYTHFYIDEETKILVINSLKRR